MTSRTQGELDIVLAPAGGDDLPGIEALLSGSQLPTTDVAQHLGGFILARAEGRLVGTVALERYGDVALLRSVCVAPSHRSHRVGRALLDAIESDAASHGIHTCISSRPPLPTTSRATGSRRSRVIRRRPRFSRRRSSASLCPSSAVCMQKAVGRDAS